MNIVLSFSGGLDSTTLLAQLLEDGHRIVGLITVNYGQRHAEELKAARKIATYYGYKDKHHLVDLSPIRKLIDRSSQTSRKIAVPKGHYTEESMKATVVPNRNMMLLAIAGAAAINFSADAIAYAAHAGDHAIYPDCRREFVEAMNTAFKLADWTPIEIMTPFVELTKSHIARLAGDLSVPISRTWSCYNPMRVGRRHVHCGACGTCVERREAFMLAEVPDPTVYHRSAPKLAFQVVGDADGLDRKVVLLK